MRILLVDDDKHVRGVLRAFFEMEGFEVFEAAEGKSAVEIAREHPLDVVLTDLRMPGPDGFTVLKEIRQIRSEAAVLIFSGYASLAEESGTSELDCDGYVKKPVRLDELKHLIYQGLIKRRGEGNSEGPEP